MTNEEERNESREQETPNISWNDTHACNLEISTGSPHNIVMNRGRSRTDSLPEIEHEMRGVCGSTFPSYGKSIGLALDTIVVLPSETKEGQYDHEQKHQEQPPSSSLPQDEESLNGIIASSEFLVKFPSQPLDDNADDNYQVIVQINGNNLDESFLRMSLPKNSKVKHSTGTGMCNFVQGHSTKPSTDTLDQLVKQNILIPGRNLLRYILIHKTKTSIKVETEPYSNTNAPQSTGIQLTGNEKMGFEYVSLGQAEAYCFLWSVRDKIIISDIDGTVTKSDVRGVIDSIVTEKYDHVHDGVCDFFTELVQHEKVFEKDDDISEKKESSPTLNTSSQRGRVRVLYLSSRPMKLIKTTRKFLSLVSQSQVDKSTIESKTPISPKNRRLVPCMDSSAIEESVVPNSFTEFESSVGMPPGPIFLHTGTLSTVLMTEIIKKSTHEFKADLLARQVVLPFVAAGKNSARTPLFVAGFGNKRTDLLAYEMAGVRSHDIYIINKKSELVSTMKTLEYEGDNMDLPVAINCCNVLETFSSFNDSNEGFLSEKVISVTNPDKNSNSSSNRKRIFQGYRDPLLRLELLHRLRSH